LFRSEKTALELFVRLHRCDRSRVPDVAPVAEGPPNMMLSTLADPIPDAPAGEATIALTQRAVTHLPDPTPAVRAIKKRLVKYKRKDGIDLSFTLYTPPVTSTARVSRRS